MRNLETQQGKLALAEKDLKAELTRTRENADEKAQMWKQAVEGKERELEAVTLMLGTYKAKAEEKSSSCQVLEEQLRSKQKDAEDLRQYLSDKK